MLGIVVAGHLIDLIDVISIRSYIILQWMLTSQNFDFHTIFSIFHLPIPVVESPPRACSQISRWLGACKKVYFVTSVKSRQNIADLISSLVVIRLFQNQLLKLLDPVKSIKS